MKIVILISLTIGIKQSCWLSSSVITEGSNSLASLGKMGFVEEKIFVETWEASPYVLSTKYPSPLKFLRKSIDFFLVIVMRWKKQVLRSTVFNQSTLEFASTKFLPCSTFRYTSSLISFFSLHLLQKPGPFVNFPEHPLKIWDYSVHSQIMNSSTLSFCFCQ